MGGVRKRFDKELYAENDKLVKDKTIELFSGISGVELKPGKNRYDVDFHVYEAGQHTFNLEVERKKVWIGDKFQWDSVQFPERKAKFAKLDKNTIFLMFNNDLTHHLTVSSQTLLASPLKEVYNKYVKGGEMFYQVPIEKVVFNTLYVRMVV